MVSTVDIVLGTDSIRDSLEYCRIYDIDYGSDYRLITLRARLQPKWQIPKRKRRLYKDADWEKIRAAIKTNLGEIDMERPIWVRGILDHKAKIFIDTINRVLEESVPRAKESLYAKR
jgi:hypothetical protein